MGERYDCAACMFVSTSRIHVRAVWRETISHGEERLFDGLRVEIRSRSVRGIRFWSREAQSHTFHHWTQVKFVLRSAENCGQSPFLDGPRCEWQWERSGSSSVIGGHQGCRYPVLDEIHSGAGAGWDVAGEDYTNPALGAAAATTNGRARFANTDELGGGPRGEHQQILKFARLNGLSQWRLGFA